MNIFICPFCGSERINKRSLTSHQNVCKLNPNRSKHDLSYAGRVGNIKSQQTRQNRKLALIEEYENHPNTCPQCVAVIPYDMRKNKFCCFSCRTSYNNKRRCCKSGPIKGYVSKSSFIKRMKKLLCPKYITKRVVCKTCGDLFWTTGESKCCSDKCRRKIYSETAKNNPKMGGNKNTRAYGWYDSIYAGTVWLESSWEYRVAKSLDENEIVWCRPEYLPYGNKKYFPDFYLSDYNVYIDPKNPYLQKVDSEKIRQVCNENSVEVFMLNADQLEWKIIKELIKCPVSIGSDAPDL